jgi:hypothetical protein
MIDDPEKIMLRYVGFIQEKIVEKRKGSGVFLDIHQFQIPAPLMPILSDQLCKLGDFVSETDKEEQSAQ